MATIDVKDAAGATVAVEKPLAPGRAAAAASRPVVLSTEDSATVGALTETAPATDTASSGLNGRLQRVAQRVTSLISLFPASLGGKTAANSFPVVLSSDGPFALQAGSITETAPATDIASSGLNGRLQRISQRITSLIALLTSTAYSDANRLPVDDRDGLAVSGTLTATGNLFSQDMLGYESITVQVTSAGTTCTITYETSDDNTNWLATIGTQSSLGANIFATTTTGAVLSQFPRRGRYFRARVSTYTSGTVTVVGTLSKSPNAPMQVTGLVAGSGNFLVTGSAAEGGTASAPVMVGAEVRTSNKTAVANGVAVRTIATQIGAYVQKPYSIPEADWSYVAPSGGKTATGGVTIIAAAAAGIRNYITGMQIANSGAAGTEVQIKDGAGGAVIWRGYIGAAAGSTQVTFQSPIKSTAATLLELDLSSSTTVAVFVNCQGYQAP